MEKYSSEWWMSLECEPGCANCCSKDCNRLIAKDLCGVHSKRLGVTPQEAWRMGRGDGCHKPPIELFTFGYYCPVVVREIEGIQKKRIEHYTDSRGVECLKDFRGVMAETRKIRGFTD